jgi:hypothetical protein
MDDPLISEETKDSAQQRVTDKLKKKWGYTTQDPYLDSNFISKIFFWWAFKIIKVFYMINAI